MPLRAPHLVLAVALAVGTLTVGAAHASHAEAAPTTFHLDCSAKALGDGSTTHPWNTLQLANGHVFQPGERLLLRRGTRCSGQLAPQGSGTRTAPVVVGAYGSGSLPTIAGGGTPNGTGTVQLVDQQYWTIEDLHVSNATASKNPRTYRSGVLIHNTGVGRLRGLTISGLKVDDVRSNPADGALGPRDWGGISVLTDGAAKDGFDGLRISGNTVSNVSRTGIIVSNHQYPKSWDSGTRIDHNVVSHARGDGIFVLGTKKGLIDHNVARYNGKILPCPQCSKSSRETASVAIWTLRSDRMMIEYNEAYGQSAVGGDGNGFDIDAAATNAILQYNYAHDNQGGGVFLCGSVNATVRFNILENNAKSAFTFIGSMPARNTAIYNNTVYISSRTKAGPMGYFNGARGSKISFNNNIVFNYGFATWRWAAKHTTAANTLVGLHSAGRPTDPKTSYHDPQLKRPGSGGIGFGSLKGYRPKHPSAFKRGVAIPKTVTRDFFGKKIDPKHPPRGAAA